ncbi:plant cysteine oxidase 2-like [Vicia villosa]|uniref:plant cysteine oxidase 2-like n=1 Tax=Vicia villosa TaxID=3911 RepID=UPI00273C2125|nr:plant cysteine oxidase 2-like [Vicia villosa]
MGIERNLKDRKGRELCKVFDESNANDMKSRKNRRHRHWMKMSPVQKLFFACQHVFANASPGVVPPSQHIDLLRSILAGIKPEDLGLKPDMPYFTNNNAGTPKITYLHIFECEKFSMGIFCLPPSAVIPLHNHPEMTVFSKLLFGTMHIKSYDWAVNLPADVSQKTSEKRLAKVKVDADFTAPCDPSILYPNDGGNMHCFTAVTACAVLDVLGPPYSDPDGRHCSYYQSFPFFNFPVDGTSIPEEEKKEYEWLEEREKPESLQVIVKMYSSPKIMEN